MLERLCGLNFIVEGRERIPAGNHIVMSNHTSAWETVAQFVIFPPQVWVLKRELLWIPFVGWGLKLLRPIAINRGEGHRAVNQVIEQGKARLADGLWVIIFPEGTRVVAGETRKFGVSGALLATATGKLLVPLSHNAGAFWPRRGFVKKARHDSRDHRRAASLGGKECEGSERGGPPGHRVRLGEDCKRLVLVRENEADAAQMAKQDAKFFDIGRRQRGFEQGSDVGA